ncbi:hypothetical protein V2J09_000015 [Rumex salicifolius]
MTQFAQNFFSSASLPIGCNDTLTVLIPKMSESRSLTNFRPISLCNVIYKVVTKVLTIRLKTVMSELMGPFQGSFLPGRLITDNIIAQEVVHTLNRKTGRRGAMILKLDLEKAYEKLNWNFVEASMRAVGLPANWVDWIGTCIRTLHMQLLWNGKVTRQFTPTRGIRQGDPISPYIFILCIERLSHLIINSVKKGEWRPISLNRGGPRLSHMFFVDDIILFAEASIAHLRIILHILNIICQAKFESKLFVSKNVGQDLKARLQAISGFTVSEELGVYLGMPILNQNITKADFRPLLDKFSAKLSGWKMKSLSLAGRITLTKFVLTSLLVYTMATIPIPVSICEQLDQVCKNFIWESFNGARRMHKVGCQEVYETLESSVAWEIMVALLHEEGKLWTGVLMGKYIRKKPLTQVSSSHIWRGIQEGVLKVVVKESRWLPGNDLMIRFWSWADQRGALVLVFE